MTNQVDATTAEDEDEATLPDQLTLLKGRANQMGLSFHPSIGLEALQKKVNDALNSTSTEASAATTKDTPIENAAETADVTGSTDTTQAGLQPAPARLKTAAEGRMERRAQIRGEALALVRCRISNLNPQKNDLNGEIFTVSNKYIGDVKQFIPYGDASENGYHVKKCLFDLLKSKKYLQLRTVKSQMLGKPDTVKQRWVPEFNLEVLPMLTKAELVNLEKMQAAKAGADE